MVPEVNIIDGKASAANVDEAGRFYGCSNTHSGGFRGSSPLGKCLGSREHVDWFKIDLNAAELLFKTINTHTHTHTHKIMQMEVHIYGVKATSQAGNI